MQDNEKLKDSQLKNVTGGSTDDTEIAENTPPGSDATDIHAPGDISVPGKTVPRYIIQYKHS